MRRTCNSNQVTNNQQYRNNIINTFMNNLYKLNPKS